MDWKEDPTTKFYIVWEVPTTFDDGRYMNRGEIPGAAEFTKYIFQNSLTSRIFIEIHLLTICNQVVPGLPSRIL